MVGLSRALAHRGRLPSAPSGIASRMTFRPDPKITPEEFLRSSSSALFNDGDE